MLKIFSSISRFALWCRFLLFGILNRNARDISSDITFVLQFLLLLFYTNVFNIIYTHRFHSLNISKIHLSALYISSIIDMNKLNIKINKARTLAK